MEANDALARPSRARFLALHVGLPLALAALLLAVFELTPLDTAIEDRFYDPQSREFPWRHTFLFEDLIHDAGKIVVIAFGVLVLGAFVASFFRERIASWRRPLAYVFLTLALGPAATSGWKDLSPKHCPWDLAMYGGHAPHTTLLEPVPEGVKRGRCFPCGQASSGFSLMALYFALRHRNRKLARRGLWLGLAYGGTLGFGRMVQGAHFLSHVLTTALVCWLVAWLLYEVVLRKSEERRTAPFNAA
ncbi:MAG: phosphatase PAP2 family protein [Planctomycetaceae bacterium]|nr:phosphatase PAP2 family protein [Planctomycetaceae bacterium]